MGSWKLEKSDYLGLARKDRVGLMRLTRRQERVLQLTQSHCRMWKLNMRVGKIPRLGVEDPLGFADRADILEWVF